MTKFRWQWPVCLQYLLLSVAVAHGAPADYPVKPIRLIVPLAPGGTTDILARIVGQHMNEALGSRVVVDNRPGAAGNIGTELAAKAAPDGYTLLMGFDGTMVINPSVYRELPFDTLRDFAPVSKVADLPVIIVAHPGVAAANAKELVALAKSRPGTVTYSSAGLGSTGHLAGELMSQRSGIRMTHVPYKGGGQAVADVIGGQVQLLFVAIPTVQPHIIAGKLKAIAVTSGTRSAAMPEVQTLAEAGLTGFAVASWVGMFAPRSTSPVIVATLQAQIARIVQTPETRNRLLILGAEPRGNSPAEFATEVRDDIARWAKVVSEANIPKQ